MNQKEATTMNKLKSILIFTYGLSVIVSHAQPVDSVLTVQDFIQWVDQQHPILKSVGNLVPIANAEHRKTQGAFDPYFGTEFTSKEFDGEVYYNHPSWELTAATRSPLRLGMNWNSSSGLYTNPSDKLPEEGLFAIGGMIDLGNGLLTDRRRTDLALAKVGIELTQAEAELYRNELLTKAVKDYWKWYYAYSNLEANENAYKAAIEIYEFTLQSYKAGDASLMDTLEAKSLVNTWQTEYYNSQAEAINAKFIVSNWLWSIDEKPIILKPFVQPSPDIPEYSNSSTLSDDHPLLRYNDQKEEQYQLKRKLSVEYLKPKIAIGGAYLLTGNISSPPNSTMFNSENRIIKAQLGIPLFLREGRGYYESQRLQLENYRWERSSMENEWRNAMESVAGQFIYLESAVSAGISNQKTLERLLQAEQRKLELGDSELIKVNLRTGYYAKAMIQRAKLESELGQTWAYWMQLSNGY